MPFLISSSALQLHAMPLSPSFHTSLITEWLDGIHNEVRHSLTIFYRTASELKASSAVLLSERIVTTLEEASNLSSKSTTPLMALTST